MFERMLAERCADLGSAAEAALVVDRRKDNIAVADWLSWEGGHHRPVATVLH
jgi:hypothetical protein